MVRYVEDRPRPIPGNLGRLPGGWHSPRHSSDTLQLFPSEVPGHLSRARLKIDSVSPFNQALSDNGKQPILVVITPNGEKHIMQGNHRVYYAWEERLQNVGATIFTPQQWEIYTESPFVPRDTNNPAIKP